jgi:hypothetical protein
MHIVSQFLYPASRPRTSSWTIMRPWTATNHPSESPFVALRETPCSVHGVFTVDACCRERPLLQSRPVSSTTQQPITAEAMRDLQRRVRELSADTSAAYVAVHDGPEDLQSIARRQAEDSFQYALQRRTWWRLQPAERDLIRSLVLAESSYYSSHPEGYAFEAHCITEIGRILLDAHSDSA